MKTIHMKDDEEEYDFMDIDASSRNTLTTLPTTTTNLSAKINLKKLDDMVNRIQEDRPYQCNSTSDSDDDDDDDDDPIMAMIRSGTKINHSTIIQATTRSTIPTTAISTATATSTTSTADTIKSKNKQHYYNPISPSTTTTTTTTTSWKGKGVHDTTSSIRSSSQSSSRIRPEKNEEKNYGLKDVKGKYKDPNRFILDLDARTSHGGTNNNNDNNNNRNRKEQKNDDMSTMKNQCNDKEISSSSSSITISTTGTSSLSSSSILPISNRLLPSFFSPTTSSSTSTSSSTTTSYSPSSSFLLPLQKMNWMGLLPGGGLKGSQNFLHTSKQQQQQQQKSSLQSIEENDLYYEEGKVDENVLSSSTLLEGDDIANAELQRLTKQQQQSRSNQFVHRILSNILSSNTAQVFTQRNKAYLYRYYLLGILILIIMRYFHFLRTNVEDM